MEITREQLVKAFKKWNSDFLTNPDSFGEITIDSAEQQADYIIELLREQE